jgi:hypothetical protein
VLQGLGKHSFISTMRKTEIPQLLLDIVAFIQTIHKLTLILLKLDHEFLVLE